MAQTYHRPKLRDKPRIARTGADRERLPYEYNST
jgi:hypothetical protein